MQIRAAGTGCFAMLTESGTAAVGPYHGGIHARQNQPSDAQVLNHR
jgi:hypothetical protein